jgi:hypothetical protein
MEVTSHIDSIIKDVDSCPRILRKAKEYHKDIVNELEDMAKIFEKMKVKFATKVL